MDSEADKMERENKRKSEWSPRVEHRDIETEMRSQSDPPPTDRAWGIWAEKPDLFKWLPEAEPIGCKVRPTQNPEGDEDEEARLEKEAETQEILQPQDILGRDMR
jgi:hypothetical protein